MGQLILLAAFAFHAVSLILLFLGARWLGRQRRFGYPDPRARAIDRRGILLAIGAAWIWAQAVIIVGAAAMAGRS